MCVFKEGLSLITRRLSSNSNTNFVFSLLSAPKFSKDGVWLQSNKWLLMSTTLKLNFLLSQCGGSNMLPNSYIKVPSTFTIIEFIAESSLKVISNTKCNFFRNAIFKAKSICLFVFNVQQERLPLRDFLNLVLVCNDNGLS